MKAFYQVRSDGDGELVCFIPEGDDELTKAIDTAVRRVLGGYLGKENEAWFTVEGNEQGDFPTILERETMFDKEPTEQEDHERKHG